MMGPDKLNISYTGAVSAELQALHDDLQSHYLKTARFIHRRFSRHDVLIAVDDLRAQSTGYFDANKATSWDVYWQGEKGLATHFKHATAQQAQEMMASDLAVLEIKEHHRDVLLRSIAEAAEKIELF